MSMVVIDKFLGRRVLVPEELRYDARQGLWARPEEQSIVFGLTQPALVLSGGVKDVDRLVEEGAVVQDGEALLFAITGKIMYLEAPIAGRIDFNPAVRENISCIEKDPYGAGWLFCIAPEEEPDRAWTSLSSAEEYLKKLRYSEGFKNPEGVKGGVSGMCKAVYSGIGEQKI
jgi:glycine cleavage system H lipoate-binding protein